MKRLFLLVIGLMLSSGAFALDVTFVFPDAVVPRIIATHAEYFGYQDVFVDEFGNETPNPETKAQFVKRMWQGEFKRIVVDYEERNAAETAADSARDTAQGQIEIQ